MLRKPDRVIYKGVLFRRYEKGQYFSYSKHDEDYICERCWFGRHRRHCLIKAMKNSSFWQKPCRDLDNRENYFIPTYYHMDDDDVTKKV